MNQKIPHTPFSTPLSGSAKETELRLKNIFSGPKKRPPVLFLALMFSLCIFCGNLVSCNVVEQAPDASSTPEEKRGEAAEPQDGSDASQNRAGDVQNKPDDTQDKAGDVQSKISGAVRDSQIAGSGQAPKDEPEDKKDTRDDEDWSWADEMDDKKDEWDKSQMAEYEAAGVSRSGKSYYYQGQLVNIFLDIRPNKSFYTLDLNPAGTVNVKILRGDDGQIVSAAYMTDAEAAELLKDRSDGGEDEPETKAAEIIPISLETVPGGEIVWLGEYELCEGDRIRYNVSVETGTRLQIGFAKPGGEDLNTTYYSVTKLRKDGALDCDADMTFRPPADPGAYKLFLRAADDALGNVKGSVSITAAKP